MAKKNIFASVFIKGTNILIGLLLVPLTINYLDDARYGIWLTLTSIVAWFGFFDIGLGNGLRNKFAEAKAKKEFDKIKVYVSTTYTILSVIMIVFFGIFVIVNTWLPWDKILNVPADLNDDLKILSLVVFASFSLSFVLNLITTMLVADQRPAIRDLTNLIGKILILILIFGLVNTQTSSLVLLGIAYTTPSLLVLILTSFYFFSKDYRPYIPSIKHVDLSYAKELISLGFRFFVLQIGALVLHATDNIIISQLFSPKEVTPYYISYKYFGVLIFFFTVVITPFWSSMTDAYTKGDTVWIKKTINTLLKVGLFFMALMFIQLLISDKAYKFWVGEDITIPWSLSITMMLVFMMRLFNTIFTYFLNGVGKTYVSIFSAVFNIFLNIPLSIFFAKYLNFGVVGVIMATGVTATINLVVRPIQYHKIINKKAKGIWNK